MEKQVKKLQKLIETEDLSAYKAVPFWSWNNSLDKSVLVSQIEDMHKAGMGGFIIHARTGLTTEYLSEEWFACVDVCLRKAKELHMNAWIYDENGWPSGFVGGKLLERKEYLAQFLEYSVKPNYDPDAFCVYKKTEEGYIRVYQSSEDLSEYHHIYLRTSPANTDILNPNVVEEFIQLTHEEYYKRFADSFGAELVGFFTDEPQYYRWGTPFTRFAVEPYKEKYGTDIEDGLIFLFIQDEEGYEFRTRYYTLLNNLYTNTFYKKLYNWCEDHGCKLTGHSIEESGLHCQMFGGAGCMPSYEFEHIPAIDSLRRDCGLETAPKQVASVAAQLGKKQVLTETFGCAGYDVTPQELKSIAEYQYFNGVNLMCHHLYPYSLAGQGKHDHPPIFSKQCNWFDEMREFNDYFTRLGYIIANTKEDCDVLIIHPMRSVYLDYLRDKGYYSVQKLEDEFNALLLLFRKKGIQYHFADEWILERHGLIEEGKLRIGECKYDTIVVPYMPSIASTTLTILGKFTGDLYMVEQPQYVDGKKGEIALSSTISMEALFSKAKLQYECEDGRTGITSRKSNIGEFLFIKNYSRTEPSLVKMQNITNRYIAIDLLSFSTKRISNECILQPNEGLVLMRDEDVKAELKITKEESVTNNFLITSMTDNYCVLDYASLSFDGKSFTEEMPLPQLFEKLLRERYQGKVYIRQSFNIDSKSNIKVIVERNRYAFVKVNERPIGLQQCDFDINFLEGDISSCIQEGENILDYCIDYFQHEGVYFALFDPMATESIRNCLYYDTHIENAYLKGDFIIGEDGSLKKRVCMPQITSKNHLNGYPFFAGELSLLGWYDYNGEGTRELSLAQGRFCVANVYINDAKVNFAMQTVMDITKYLNVGKNRIRIILKSSLRNLLGPHHYKLCAEPMSVYPFLFTMRGHWQDGEAKYYTHEYNCVPFGLDEIEIITKE